MKIKSLIALVSVTLLVTACSKDPQEERLSWASSLFTGVEQYQNFNRVYEFFPTSELVPSNAPLIFEHGPSIELPSHFIFQDNLINVNEYLSRTDVTALLILKDGKIRYENYWLTGGKSVKWLSASVAKSFISALIGIAIDQGYINSIDDAVTVYVPQLKDSAYDGVRIKDILQMSSGASWNEDYSDPNSDINRSVRIFALGGSLDEFTASLKNEKKPGTFNRYNSTDTQVLGMLLREATGISVTQYMQKMLWDPIGAEDNAYWLLDSENMEVAYGGFNATARDYAKLGELYRLEGNINGTQIVPSNWIQASITPDAAHLMPGENALSDYPLGYGYQWWIPDDSGDFMAIGVYNQFIYVSPQNNVVAVQLSANNIYGTNEELSTLSEFESISFLKAITNKN
ncbi:MAG: serine hydrolase [Pseudomonadota bacterium]|nr:serine hydrolase [Pseudomonadota bacterium]